MKLWRVRKTFQNPYYWIEGVLSTPRGHFLHTGHSYRLRTRVENQNYPTWWLCDICSVPISLYQGEILREHNHITNQFRGWTCSSCNSGLGMFQDSISNLEAAVRYLRKTS